jgi:hypothetical protein
MNTIFGITAEEVRYLREQEQIGLEEARAKLMKKRALEYIRWYVEDSNMAELLTYLVERKR